MDGNGSTDETQRRTRQRKMDPRTTEGPPDAAADCFSALPDALLLHILSFLDIWTAISTSTLSRRWRYLWHSLPSLDLSLPSLDLLESPEEPPRTWLVDRVLLLHSAPRIERFRLQICGNDHEGFTLAAQIDSWALFAARRGVRVLDLDFLAGNCRFYETYANPDYGLPPCLFSCGSLEALTSRFCYLRLPTHVRLSSLKTMRLSWVHFYDDDLELLLSGCPLLQSLRLAYCNLTSNLHIAARENRHLESLEVHEGVYEEYPDKLEMAICAPSLKRLSVDGSVARGRYRVMDLSSLVVASFNVELDLDCADGEDRAIGDFTGFADLLEHVHHVQVLKLCSWCLQALSVREVQGLYLSSCFNVMSLELSIGFQKWELPGIFGAFRACSELRILTLYIHPKITIEFKEGFLDEYDFDETEYLRACVLSFQNVMRHLKTIKIEAGTGYGFNYQQKESTVIEGRILDERSILEGYDEEEIGDGEEQSEGADCMSQKRATIIVLIGFLLKVSPVLEKLIVQTSNDMNKLAKECFNLSSDLQSLPRASPNARVIINGK